MPLCRLLYFSRLCNARGAQACLGELSLAAQVRSARQALTGCVLTIDGWMLHCIEGARAHVNGMWTESSTDCAHSDLTLVSFKEIEERRFRSWEAGTLDERDLRATLEPFLVGNRFEPETYTAHTYDLLFARLAERIAAARQSILEVEFVNDPVEPQHGHWQRRKEAVTGCPDSSG